MRLSISLSLPLSSLNFLATMEATSQPQPHAVIIPAPLQGHINPLINLSLHLSQTYAFTITFVNNHSNHARLQHSLSTLPSHNQLHRFRFLAISDGLPSHHKRDVSIEFLQAVTDHMGRAFDDLIADLIHDPVFPPITCIIDDMFMPFSSRVSTKYNIPLVSHFSQSAVSFACHDIITHAVSPDTESATDSTISHLCNLINTIPGVPRLQWTDNITFLQSADPSDFFFKFMTRPFKHLLEPAVILLNSCEELEDCSFLKERQVLTVGPLLPSPYLQEPGDTNASHSGNLSLWPEESECLEWLDTQQTSSVVYVSYGSLAVMSAKQLEEFALGLEATEMPFLWVLRPDLVGGETPIFPQGLLDRVKGRAHFVSWAPQLQVLSHVSVGAFLTHGGWNSTLESMAQGIPMICWPWFADQKLDRRLIVDKWRIGVEFEADEEGLVRREEVERKVRRVMEEEGKEMRGRAGEMREAVRRAVAEGGSSHKNMETFVHRIVMGAKNGMF